MYVNCFCPYSESQQGLKQQWAPSYFVLHRRKKAIQICKDMRASKWWQNFNFGLKHDFKSLFLSFVLSVGIYLSFVYLTDPELLLFSSNSGINGLNIVFEDAFTHSDLHCIQTLLYCMSCMNAFEMNWYSTEWKYTVSLILGNLISGWKRTRLQKTAWATKTSYINISIY